MIDTTTMPTYEVTLQIQCDIEPAKWVEDNIRQYLEEDEYVRLLDINEVYERHTSVEHHGGTSYYSKLPPRY